MRAIRKRRELAEDVDWEIYQWQDFFTIEELEEMNKPGFMDEVEAIVKGKTIAKTEFNQPHTPIILPPCPYSQGYIHS